MLLPAAGWLAHYRPEWLKADFVAGQGVLNVTGPASGRKAPPGPYLVFIVNASGVPSEAKILNISSGS